MPRSLLRALVCSLSFSMTLKPCVHSSALAEDQPSVGMAVASQDIQLTVVFERFGAPQLLLVLNCLLTEQKILVRIAAACIAATGNMQQTTDVRHAIGDIRRTAESMPQTPCDIATCAAEPLGIRATCALAADVRHAADDVPDARRWIRNGCRQRTRSTDPRAAHSALAPFPFLVCGGETVIDRAANSEWHANAILVQLCSTEPKRLHLGAKALTAMMQPLYWSYP